MVTTSNGSSFEVTVLIEHIDGLYSYALVLTRNRSDAEDLVQETYLRAIPAMGRLQAHSNIKSWLFTILRNIWLNQLRQSRNGRQVSEIDIDQYSADIQAGAPKDPHSSLVSMQDREQVRTAIQQLPMNFREIILLREYEELSYQEIAGVLKCPVGTVMSRLGRARSRLRTLLSATMRIAGSPISESNK
ncbi:MAG: sigma-70 family RNA polymerase sigma factor [Edaphobacter sp.]